MVSSLCLSILQNYFGLCFSMSGSVNCSLARPCLHCATNYLNASTVCLCIFPFCLTAARYFARAILHLASYHGARCFAHLLGFLGLRVVYAVMTPAFSASRSRNSSILVVQVLLSTANSVAMALKAEVNVCVDVCASHRAALLLYSLRHSPSTQRYYLSSSPCRVSFAGVSVLGLPTLCLAGGPPFCVGVCPVDGGACLPVDSGRTVYSRSWSVMLWACRLVCCICRYYLLHKI